MRLCSIFLCPWNTQLSENEDHFEVFQIINYTQFGAVEVFFFFFLIPSDSLFFWLCPTGLWDLSSLTRDCTRPSAVRAHSPNHWTARELLVFLLIDVFKHLMFKVVTVTTGLVSIIFVTVFYSLPLSFIIFFVFQFFLPYLVLTEHFI